jgi:hypothetical protein
MFGMQETPIIPTGQQSPLLKAVAEKHALPDMSNGSAPPLSGSATAGLPAGAAASPLMEAVLQQHAVPNGKVQASVAEATGQRSNWLSSLFNKAPKGPQGGPPAQQTAATAGGRSPQAGALVGSFVRAGNSLTASFTKAAPPGPHDSTLGSPTQPLTTLGQAWSK